jgi:hypothetical protein
MTKLKNPAQTSSARFTTEVLTDGTVHIAITPEKGQGIGIVVSPQVAIEQIGIPAIKCGAAALAIAMHGEPEPSNQGERKQ